MEKKGKNGKVKGTVNGGGESGNSIEWYNWAGNELQVVCCVCPLFMAFCATAHLAPPLFYGGSITDGPRN